MFSAEIDRRILQFAISSLGYDSILFLSVSIIEEISQAHFFTHFVQQESAFSPEPVRDITLLLFCSESIAICPTL